MASVWFSCWMRSPSFASTRLVQAVAPSASRHQSSREFVDDNDFAFFDHIFDITLVQGVCPQGLIDVMDEFDIFRRVLIEEVVNPQQDSNIGRCLLRSM